MLSRELLRDTVNALPRCRTGRVGPAFIQRWVRVGYATAAQLGQALEDAGILGRLAPGGQRPIGINVGTDGAHRMVEAAIADGRIVLDVDLPATAAEESFIARVNARHHDAAAARLAAEEPA